MTVITPQSDVYLLKVPLEIDNENQLTFANATAQETYFKSLPKLGFDDFTYIRKDGVLRVPALIDDLYSYNYVMYKNDAYSSKWFYAYITGMEYMNDSVTDISIATDTFQTWQFDLTYKRTFVEREHTNNDAIGANTVPENLDTGEMVVAYESDFLDTFDDEYHGSTYPRIVELMAVTCLPNGSSPQDNSYPYDRRINGLAQGLFFMVFTDSEQLANAVSTYDKEGRADAIYSICEAYKSLFDSAIYESPYTYISVKGAFQFYIPSETNGGEANCLMSSQHVEYPNTLVNGKYIPTFDGYQVKNMKMLTYPFSYLRVTNHAGGEAIYKWEDFTLGTTTPNDHPYAYFKAFGSVSVSPNYKIAPCNYKKNYHTFANKEPNYDYGLTGQKLPPCSWISDYFTNWITQNGVNILTGGITDVTNAGVAGVQALELARTPLHAQLGMAGVGASLFTNVANTLAGIYQRTRIPDQVKGDANTGDLNYSIGYTGWSIYGMTLRNEFAQRIDQFFSCFGYQINQVKVPNITGRRNWNYVKTSSCYIEADIPQDDLQQIKDMFNKGITLWHNPSTFCDYSQNNDIIQL